MTPKDLIKITINLVVIYVVGGLILAGVYARTSPIIYKKNEQEKKEALQRMMPSAQVIEKFGDWYPHEKRAEYFVARKDDSVIGYVIQTFGKGYSSYINILVAAGTDYRVQRIDILGHAETPGLGDEIETDWFKKQFEGKDIEHLKVLKTETTEYIQAISGATISSRAVSEDGVRRAIEFLKEKTSTGIQVSRSSGGLNE